MAEVVYVNNTNEIWLYNLKSDIEGGYIDNADVTVTVYDAGTSNEVDGSGVWPLTMTLLDESPSKGNYYAVLPDTIGFADDELYTAVISVDAGPDRVGHWEFRFTAQTRSQ